SPPCGEFVLQPATPERPLVLIAGGVGITPILSMLHAALRDTPERPVVFIQGALNSKVHPFRQELAALKRDHPNLTTHVRYSEPLPADRVGASHDSEGLIDNALLSDLVGERSAEYYFCGPSPMLKAVYQLLRGRNVAETDIHYEFFGP